MKKQLLHLAISICCAVFFFQPTWGNENVVRVAFLPDMYGFYKIDDNGDYSGYNYEYLMNLSQHTGWEYEFVIVEEGLVSASLVKAEEMLAAGEIDLLGPFSAASANFDNYESGERNYGVYRYNLFSARKNYAITRDNYFLQDTLRVALVEPFTDLNEHFFHTMELTNQNLEITYVQTHGETHTLLMEEEVDAIINLDLSINAENLDYLTTIDRIPFYFVSTKGNTKLIGELDEGIRKLEVKEPEIHQILSEKYFGTRYEGEFLFTEEETALLDKFDSFKVGMLRDEPPYQYVDELGNNTGISVDIIHILGEIIEKPIEIIWKNSHEALVTAIESGEVDMISTVPNDYTLANSLSVVLSNPYISSNAYWLKHVNEVENPEILYHFVSSNIPFYSKSEIRTTLNIGADLETLNKDGTLSIFCDPHVAAYHLNLNQYDNIELKAVTDVLSELSLGVSGEIDETLVGVINRAILYLDSYEIDEIVFKHTSVKPQYTLIDIFKEYAHLIWGFSIFFALLVVTHLLNISKTFRELSRRDSMTKLYNSGYFHHYCGETTKKLPEGALILVDIDFFKNVNDSHGHHAGDEIIKLVAKNIEKISTPHCVNARLGGDEFAVLIQGPVDKDSIQRNAQLLLDAMSQNETGIVTTLSIGAYMFKTPTDYTSLYKLADKVLYQVKEDGRNGFKVSVSGEESVIVET